MSKTSIQINSVIICDDIRRELSGKATFVGVFPGDIKANARPAQLSLSFWFDCSTKESINKFEARITLTDKKTNSSSEILREVLENETKFKTPITAVKPISFALMGLTILVEEDSILTISARPFKGRWKELTKRNISLSTSSSEIGQPS